MLFISPRWLLHDLYHHLLLRVQSWRGERGAGGAQKARKLVQLRPPRLLVPVKMLSWKGRW